MALVPCRLDSRQSTVDSRLYDICSLYQIHFFLMFKKGSLTKESRNYIFNITHSIKGPNHPPVLLSPGHLFNITLLQAIDWQYIKSSTGFISCIHSF